MAHNLDFIRSEADLERFIESDPFMLVSRLHGQARFAWVQHVWRADMFQTDAEWGSRPHGYPLSSVRFSDGADGEVCGVVHRRQEGHRLIVGTPGSHKFTSAIAPLALDDDGANLFVVDPKGGEGFRWTAVYRDKVGEAAGDRRGVRLLDPCGLYPGVASEGLNPLDAITPANANFVSDVDKLVDAMVVTSGHEKDPIWVMNAKKVMRGVTLHVVTAPEARRFGPTGSLLDVQHYVSEGLSDALIDAMLQNTVGEGLVQRCAMEIRTLKNAESTWLGVKFQIDGSLAFLDLPGVRKCLRATSFDIRDLRRRRLALYLVLPNSEKETMGRWLRLMYASVIDQIAAIPGRDVHVVVDEFAALRRFDRVPLDLATMRSARLRYHVIVQDLNQLQELYGHGWQSIVGNCSVRQFLGVSDNFTADYVSHALGRTTVLDGYDYQHPHPDAPPVKKPRFVGRELMSQAEVLAMNPNTMLIFADGCERPLKLPKAPYFENAPWSERAVDITSWLARNRQDKRPPVGTAANDMSQPSLRGL